MSKTENGTPRPHPEVDIRDVLRDRFSTGQGLIQLSSSMADKEMLVVVKLAISHSNGKTFTVIPPSQQCFSAGHGLPGFIQLSSGMTDQEILFIIKQAISLSSGRAFTVSPPLKKPNIS